MFFKLQVLGITKPILDVKSERKVFEYIFAFPFTELFHVVKQSLFIAQMVVTFKMIIKCLGFK